MITRTFVVDNEKTSMGRILSTRSSGLEGPWSTREKMKCEKVEFVEATFLGFCWTKGRVLKLVC